MTRYLYADELCLTLDVPTRDAIKAAAVNVHKAGGRASLVLLNPKTYRQFTGSDTDVGLRMQGPMQSMQVRLAPDSPHDILVMDREDFDEAESAA